MSNEMMTSQERALAPLIFTDEQRQMIRDSFAGGASDEEFAVLMEIAKARRLNPLLKQVHFVARWDTNKGREVWATQVSIDGLRAIAERTGLYAGQDEPEFTDGADGKPVVCKVRVYRKDWPRPAVGVAHFSEYVQTRKDKSTGRQVPSSFWQRMPHTMLAKCAESLALRKAFPEDTSGLYTPEEMGQADNDAPQPAVVQQHVPALASLGIEQTAPPAFSAPSTWAADLAACSTLRDVRACYHAASVTEAEGRAMCDDVRAWCTERGVIATAAEVTAILSTLPEHALEILFDIHTDEEREPVSRIEHVARRVAKARGEWDAHSAETAAKIVARSYAHAAGVDLRTAGATLKRIVANDEPEPPPTGTDGPRSREPGEDDGEDPAGYDAHRAAKDAQPSAEHAWRETAAGITAHVASLSSARHLEASARRHLREIREDLTTHAVHAYAGRAQRLSHDGTSALPWDECVARVETWLREGPRVSAIAPTQRRAKRAA